MRAFPDKFTEPSETIVPAQPGWYELHVGTVERPRLLRRPIIAWRVVCFTFDERSPSAGNRGIHWPTPITPYGASHGDDVVVVGPNYFNKSGVEFKTEQELIDHMRKLNSATKAVNDAEIMFNIVRTNIREGKPYRVQIDEDVMPRTRALEVAEELGAEVTFEAENMILFTPGPTQR